MSRPKGDRKQWNVGFWVTEAEKASLMAEAKAAGVSIADYFLAGRERKPVGNKVKVERPVTKSMSNTPDTARMIHPSDSMFGRKR